MSPAKKAGTIAAAFAAGNRATKRQKQQTIGDTFTRANPTAINNMTPCDERRRVKGVNVPEFINLADDSPCTVSCVGGFSRVSSFVFKPTVSGLQAGQTSGKARAKGKDLNRMLAAAADGASIALLSLGHGRIV